VYKKFEEQKNVTNVHKIISYNSAIQAWKEGTQGKLNLQSLRKDFPNAMCALCMI